MRYLNSLHHYATVNLNSISSHSRDNHTLTCSPASRTLTFSTVSDVTAALQPPRPPPIWAVLTSVIAAYLVERQFVTIASPIAQKSLLILLERKIIALIQSCSKCNHLRQVHAQVIVHGLEHSEYVVPKLISLSADLKNMRYAHCLFDQMFDPSNVIYNVMFKGYIQNREYKEVVSLYRKMVELDVQPSCYTFPMVLKSCGRLAAFYQGQQVHSVVTKNGFTTNLYVGNSLIEMYSGAGESDLAYKVFSEMSFRNIVAWTFMVSGFVSCGHMGAARRLFDLAPERDVVLWNTMVSGYIERQDLETAYKLFQQMPHKDTMAWNTMLSGYGNTGQIDACVKLFEKMPMRNVFSWNGLIGAYAHIGCFFEVLTTFQQMLSESDVLPNDVTLVTVLSACARLGALDVGRWLHLYAQRMGYEGNIYIENALVDMYAKCGEIESAIYVFKGMVRKDLISWNTMIGGLAMHGHAADALVYFNDMESVGVEPDGVTFIGILCACTHMGLIGKGIAYFQSMGNYSIIPQIEHYGCLVDLYARAGRLCEALNVVKMMPMIPDAVIWSSLLGASRIYKDVEVAELALSHLIALEPQNPSNYLMLSNIYGEAGEWESVSKLKLEMKDTRLKNAPGCSIIEVHGEVFEFYSLHEGHPEIDEIYLCLCGLTSLTQFLVCQTVDVELEQEALI